MRIFIGVVGLVVSSLIMLWSCAGAKSGMQTDIGGRHFRVEIQAGSIYQGSMRWFIFQVPVYPQIAVWLENEQGEYQGTLFVTDKAYKHNWMSAPAVGRPEALPLWTAAQQAQLDVVSSATAKKSFQSYSPLAASLPEGQYTVKLEINRSFDYNSAFPAMADDVDGQPSLLYQGQIAVGNSPASVELAIVGRSVREGTGFAFTTDLAGIDTALQLLANAVVRYVF
jgi:hypothetical protein